MRTSSSLLKLALVAELTLIGTQACMPVVMHSPRIDGGLTTGLIASHTAGPRRVRGDMGAMPYAYGPIGVNVGYGWKSGRTEGLGVRVGVYVPALVVALQPDVYVQLPKRAVAGLDAGLGVAAHLLDGSVMPYAQVGLLRAGGSGIFATYGRSFHWHETGQPYRVVRSQADVPGVAFQRVNGRTTTRFFVTAAVSRDRTCPDPLTPCARRDDWSIASGMAMEFRHRKRP